ncbi:2-amino-4-hydroxy-6-hydroxymethyldihydropteridine diphosphokinase [bacterium]|nr:2-amino-4-hydroxy-6-hydroxymethyldihydropteridine diphosphokinase [bacterium]
MIKGKEEYKTCFLQLGSNEGNRNEIMKLAEYFIQQSIGVIKNKSSYYESEPWGNSDLNWFLNSVLEVQTLLLPFELLKKTQQIERDLGRKSKGDDYANRTIDIDILFYENFIIRSPKLTIPHDKIPQRRFVLAPLVEISPQYIHPVLDSSLSYLLDSCVDDLRVTKLD